MYACVYMYVCMYVRVQVCSYDIAEWECMHVYIYVCERMRRCAVNVQRLGMCVRICVYVCTYACVHVFMYVGFRCMCACVFIIYVCIHTNTDI